LKPLFGIRDFDVSKDGRGAWKALNEHYNGSGHVSCRVEYAKAKLEKLHWSNEAVFSYDKYSTALKQCFVDLGDPQNTNELYSQRQQVDIIDLTFQTGKVVGLRLDCTDCEFSRQYVMR